MFEKSHVTVNTVAFYWNEVKCESNYSFDWNCNFFLILFIAWINYFTYNETVGYDYDTEGAVLFELLCHSVLFLKKKIYFSCCNISSVCGHLFKNLHCFREFTQKANWARYVLNTSWICVTLLWLLILNAFDKLGV